jgi:3-deoxy-D-manno-octulosonate 8-phosphate phosphatase (KDO 8-P phosphatase)
MATNDWRERASKVKLVLFDVDGVLTRGDIVYAAANESPAVEALEMKMFSVRDGAAIRWALREGLKVGILTGRTSNVVARRAKDLEIPFVWQGAKDKGAAFSRVLAETGLEASEVAAMGDDLPDLPVLLRAGVAACPADAHDEVKKRCHFVSALRGGEGAAREFLEEIFRAKGLWETILARHLAPGGEGP